MIQLDGTCATEVVAGELVEGFEFEPRCLVVVIALENEKALFDAMISAGRLLTDPFVSIPRNSTFCTTIAHGHQSPDVKIASTNCHNSHVLLRNYELDTTGPGRARRARAGAHRHHHVREPDRLHQAR